MTTWNGDAETSKKMKNALEKLEMIYRAMKADVCIEKMEEEFVELKEIEEKKEEKKLFGGAP